MTKRPRFRYQRRDYDSSSIGDFNTPIKENMEYAPSAALWKQATEHFYNIGNPDKFFNDRAQSE